jgi:hypothetical protein
LAASHAKDYNGHLGSDPFLEVLRRGADLQVLPALIAGVAAAAMALISLRRASPTAGDPALTARDPAVRAGDRLTLWLAALTLAWWVIVVGMTLDGYPGLERFFLPAAAMTCVLGGVGIVRVARLAGVTASSGATGVRGAWVPAAAAVLLVAVSIPFTTTRISTARAQEPIASRAVTRLDQLSGAVAAVGGHDGVYPCHSSFASVNHSVQTALAWKLHVTLGRVGTTMRHQGVMFVGPHDSIDGGVPRVDPRLTQQRLLTQVGVWQVYRMSTPGSDTRCVGR